MAKFWALLSAAPFPPTIFFIFVYSFLVVVFFRSHTVFIPPKFLYTASCTSKLCTSVIFCQFWLILGHIYENLANIGSFTPGMSPYGHWVQELIEFCPFTTNSCPIFKKKPKSSQNKSVLGQFGAFFGHRHFARNLKLLSMSHAKHLTAYYQNTQETLH